MTDFVTKYGKDEHLVEYIKRDICEELLNLYEGVTMKSNDDLMDDIIHALNDVPVRVNAQRFSNDMHKVECKDDVLTLLCHLGYLSYNSETKCACIPNYEVRQEFETAIADTCWKEVTAA